MTDWNEDKYGFAEENGRAQKHDCLNDSDQCDIIHPNIAKNVIATLPPHMMRQQPFPKNWRTWLQNPKVIIAYTDQHTLKQGLFNLTEVFNQMSSSAKLNIFNNMFIHILDDNEKSMFLSDLLGSKNETEDR